MTNQYSYAEDFEGKIPEVNHKKAAASNISSAAKVYMVSRAQRQIGSNTYRSGNDNGQKYMTSEDFVTYFRSRDDIRSNNAQKVVKAAQQRPMGTVNLEKEPGTIIRSASGTMPTKENVQRKKTAKPNISAAVRINKSAPSVLSGDDNVKIYTPKKKQTKSFETVVFSRIDGEKLQKIKDVANDWLPEEKIVKARPQKKDRRIGRIFLGIAGIAVSLMLIVSGSVMLSQASRDVKALENEAKELKEKESILRLELDMKNDVNVLRTRATEELGMIGKEYVEASYLDMSGVDEIKSYESDEDIGFSAILSAFGIN